MPDLIQLPYCPHCGEQAFQSGCFKPWFCQSCDFKLYPNVASAAAVFVQDEQNRVLFVERAHDPGKGKLGLPGGFLDPGETAEMGLLREIKEEVGVSVKDLKYLCSFSNNYVFGGINYDTLDLFYTATAEDKNITMDPREVAAVHWKPPEFINQQDLAFPSFKNAIECLLKNR